MKTIKKPTFGLFSLILVAGFATNVNGQTESGNINASATIQAPLVWDKTNEIQFGNIPAGSVPTLNPVDGTSTNAGATAAFGTAELSGQVGAGFNVTFPSVVELNYDDGQTTNTIYLHLDVAQENVDLTTQTFGGAAYTSGDALTFAAGGQHSFYLGGRLSGDSGDATTVIPAEQQAGTYTGTLTLTAIYN